jgi:hypothetical protein
MYDEYVLSKCKLPKKLYNQAKIKELWLTAKEVVEYGIANNYWNGEIK